MRAVSSRSRTTAYILALVVWACLLPSVCAAQWVPSPGDGTVSVEYQYTRITDHLFSRDVAGLVDSATGYVGGPGNRFYYGDIFGQTVNTTVQYGVWRGLAVTGSAAYVTSMYAGKSPESPLDDGKYHGSLQDASFTAEYMIAWQGFAIAPSVGARIPLKSYSTLGHVAVGKDLREYPVGISVGRSLDPVLPRAYVGGSFAYSFVEHHHEHSLDQRHFSLSAGYILSNSISLGGALQYVNTVDGIDWYSDVNSEEAFHDHDVAAKAEYVRAGGTASFALGRGFGISLSYIGTLSGENTHSGHSLNIAPTWRFHAPIIH